jgi:hypothetical protein
LDTIPDLIQLTPSNPASAGFPHVEAGADNTNIYVDTKAGESFYWLAEYTRIVA